MASVELYRAPIQLADFEQIKNVIGAGSYIWVPDRSGYPSRTGISSVERFTDYCNYMQRMWGDGDLVITHEHDHQITISFDNAEFQRMRDRHTHACMDYYDSKSSGGFTGD